MEFARIVVAASLRRRRTMWWLPIAMESSASGTLTPSGFSATARKRRSDNCSTSSSPSDCDRRIGGLPSGHQKRREPLRSRRPLSVPAVRKDGERISLEFSIVPLKDVQDRMMGMAAVMRDVTRRFEETKTLRKKLAEMTGFSARVNG